MIGFDILIPTALTIGIFVVTYAIKPKSFWSNWDIYPPKTIAAVYWGGAFLSSLMFWLIWYYAQF